jgi:hypothetical protein
MSFTLYQEVALTRNLPEYGLRTGDVATLIAVVAHPDGGEIGCVLEIFNAVGESIAVVTVPESSIEALEADEVFTVRSMVAA